MHILFGSILAVNTQSLLVIITVTSLSLICLAFIIRPLTIDILDKNMLKNFAMRASIYHLIFLFIVVINIVVDFQVLGTILVIGLMMLPAATARIISRSFNIILLNAILTSLIASLLGIIVSYYYDIPTGPAVILTAGFCYICAIVYSYVLRVVKRRHYRY